MTGLYNVWNFIEHYRECLFSFEPPTAEMGIYNLCQGVRKFEF